MIGFMPPLDGDGQRINQSQLSRFFFVRPIPTRRMSSPEPRSPGEGRTMNMARFLAWLTTIRGERGRAR